MEAAAQEAERKRQRQLERQRERYAAMTDEQREHRRQRKRAWDEARRKGAAVARPVEPVPYRGDVSWMDRAACAGLDTELFFQAQIMDAVRQVCAGCPVRAECLGMALAFPGINLYGFWGGTSHHERARLRRAARAREARVEQDVEHLRADAAGG